MHAFNQYCTSMFIIAHFGIVHFDMTNLDMSYDEDPAGARYCFCCPEVGLGMYAVSFPLRFGDDWMEDWVAVDSCRDVGSANEYILTVNYT